MLCVIAVTAVTLGCVDTSEEDAYSIALLEGTASEYYDKDIGYYVFEAGNVDWQAFSFGLYAPDGTMQEEITVESGMVSSSDLIKTEIGGFYQIRINYQALSLTIPIRTVAPEAVTYRSVTYHAGEGATFPDAPAGEVFSGDEGPEWTVTYENGYIDVTPTVEREGYTFKGWRTENGSQAASGVTIDTDRHYYAAWSDNVSFRVSVTRYQNGRFSNNLGSREYERNTEYALPTPSVSAEFAFAGYTILVDGVVKEEITEPGGSIVITGDTEIRVNYTTNTFTVRFIVNAADSKVGTQSHPWAEEGASVTLGDKIYEIQFIEDVISYNGSAIDGYCLVEELPYNTSLGSDRQNVPPVPAVNGATGAWKEPSGLNAQFGTVTSDLNFVASYTLASYRVEFLKPPSQYLTPEEVDAAVNDGVQVDFEAATQSNGSAIIYSDIRYGENVLARNNVFPVVPARTGYVGEWMYRSSNGSWRPVYGEDNILADELNYVTKDHTICVSYHASSYPVTLYGYSEQDPIYKGNHTYGSDFDIPDEVIAELEEKYPSSVYVYVWRNNSAQGTAVDSFPLKVQGSVNLYLTLERKPYTVHFVYDDGSGEETISIEVTPDINSGEATLDLPNISVPGYDVTGWRYNDFTDEDIETYDPSMSYQKGEKIYYPARNKVYEASVYIPDGEDQDPVHNNNWREYDSYVSTISVTSGSITVTSSHLKSDYLLENTAFYPNLEPIQYDLMVGVASFTEPGEDAMINSYKTLVVPYGSVILHDQLDDEGKELLTSPAPPEYSDVSGGTFVFDGWYLDREYTVPVDINTYVLNRETVSDPSKRLYIYPRWTDIDLGTPGLEFEDNGDGTYSVAGFDTSGYAEFSSLILYIPAYHNGGAVTTIKEGAFVSLEKILTFTELHIESSLATIEDNALRGLIGLSTIVLEEGVTAFEFTDGMLTSAADGKKVLHLYIGSGREVTVPDDIVKIAGGAFAGSDVGRVQFGNNAALTEIGDEAFFGAMDLVEVHLPASLAIIGENAFKGAVSLTEVSVAASSELKTVRRGAFDDCLGALGEADDEGFITLGGVLIKYVGSKSDITLPDSVTAIAAGAFDNDSGAAVASLTVEASSSLLFIAEGAFDGAISLVGMTILTNYVPETEAGAFDGIPMSSSLSVTADLYGDFSNNEVYEAAFNNITTVNE